MRKYVQAYLDAFKSGFINKDSIVQHIKQQTIIEEILPESASFFYVVEVPAHKYHFLGKQQVNVSGYSNEEFLERGVELLLQSIHPNDIDIVLNKIYPAFTDIVMNTPAEDRQKIQFQYNYRFQRKDGEYLNLMEQVYALEVDQDGRPTLLLGNIIMLDTKDVLPVRMSAKKISKSGFSETYISKTFRPSPNILEGITDRELDILRNLAVGKTSKEIGNELFISPHTVDTHRRNLLRKLKCRSVVELAQIAFRNGLL